MVQIPNYDQNAQPAADFTPIPAGRYIAEIIESVIEEISKSSDKGQCFVFRWHILEGEHCGRFVWQRINLWPQDMNNMDKVKEIANRQFASIREATNTPTPNESNELHHKDFQL